MNITHIAPLDKLNTLLAARFIEQAHTAINTQGSFHAVLSGGKTPQTFFSLLASPDYIFQIPWEKIHIYLSDERFVPVTHTESNIGMIKKLLLNHVPLPPQQLHAITTENITPEEAAKQYEHSVLTYAPKDSKNNIRFDFVLLGIGEDGHVASLFPDTNALTITNEMATAVFVNKLHTWRISLTFPALNHANYIAIVATGQKKAAIAHHVFNKTNAEIIYPIQLLQPQHQVEWYLDTLI